MEADSVVGTDRGLRIGHADVYVLATDRRPAHTAVTGKLTGRILAAIHYELGVNYNNLAALHAARGNLREAENLYQRALDIKQQLLGHNHPDVAMTLLEMG